jgi:hypothetical protein
MFVVSAIAQSFCDVDRQHVEDTMYHYLDIKYWTKCCGQNVHDRRELTTFFAYKHQVYDGTRQHRFIQTSSS